MEQPSLPGWLTSPVAILIGAVMIAGSILYSNSDRAPGAADVGDLLPTGDAGEVVVEDPEKLVQADDPVLGSDDAPVTIVEFSDFQCPFCRRFFNDTYGRLKSEYIDTGKARIVFRDYPLPFHDAAKPSALAANCANEQGKFWEYHDVMFLEQNKLGEGTVAYGVSELKAWAKQVGLDSAKFDSCLDSAKYDDEVEQDITDAGTYGVDGTPSFFINGKLVVGAQPFSAFKSAIDAALAE